jgi:1,4-dihydroxy-6-naphthoate synthase
VKKYSFGFSPCPNDTFMFGPLANGLFETGDLSFEPVLEDVESLNKHALSAAYDISKLSYGAYAFASSQYVLLGAGHALGQNCGPLLIARTPEPEKGWDRQRVAIPGRYTTANLLMSVFYPDVQDKTEMLFSDIEDAVLRGDYDAGVIIHENRFTYADKGLHALADLGSMWEEKTGSLIPLGCVAAKRSLGGPAHRQIDSLIRRSIKLAMDSPESALPYVREHASELDESVMCRHIDLYVNEHSLHMGEQARESVFRLLSYGHEHGLLPSPDKNPFFDQAIPI